MDIGMLWYDDDKQRDLAQKVERAAAYYAKKYGAAPTECWVNASLLAGGQEIRVGAVRVQASTIVLRDHLWLGVGTLPE